MLDIGTFASMLRNKK